MDYSVPTLPLAVQLVYGMCTLPFSASQQLSLSALRPSTHQPLNPSTRQPFRPSTRQPARAAHPLSPSSFQQLTLLCCFLDDIPVRRFVFFCALPSSFTILATMSLLDIGRSKTAAYKSVEDVRPKKNCQTFGIATFFV